MMLVGIRDVLILSTPYDLLGFERLLADSSYYGAGFISLLSNAVKTAEEEKKEIFGSDTLRE